MITIEQVIEQCAQAYEAEAHTWKAWPQAGAAGRQGATAIRALKAQYEGCIVAGGAPVTYLIELELAALKRDGRRAFVLYTEPVTNGLDVPLYRAREAK